MARATHAVPQPASVTVTDRAATDGPCPQATGGLTLPDAPSRGQALQRAAKPMPPAAARRRPGRPQPPRTRRGAPPGLTASADAPAPAERRRPAAPRQDLPGRRPDNAGSRTGLNRDSAQRLPDRARSPARGRPDHRGP